MYFRKKFEPIFYREKTVYFFTKSGLSWHDGVVEFYSNSTGHLKQFFIHKIVGNNSKQDKTSVLSMYDSAFALLKC